MEEEKIIEKIKEMRNTSDREKFLENLRLELVRYIAANPARNREAGGLFGLKRLIFPLGQNATAGKFGTLQKAASASLIVFLLGTSGAAVASQKALPGHPLYPVKILTENLRSSLAVSSESKAILEAEFAARRVSEVKILLEENGAEAEGVEVALGRLEENTERTADIIQQEKQQGTDISTLAKKINIKNDENRDALKSVIQNQKALIKNQIGQLKNEIAAAQESGNAAQTALLLAQLEKIKKFKDDIESSLEENYQTLDEENNDVENEMADEDRMADARKEAQKAINEAEDAEQELTNSIPAEKISPAGDIIQQARDVLAKAREVFGDGNYDKAKNLSEEAQDILKEAEKIIEENGFKEKETSKDKDEKNGGEKENNNKEND